MPELCTIGYENYTQPELIARLRDAGVKVLIDVMVGGAGEDSSRAARPKSAPIVRENHRLRTTKGKPLACQPRA